MSDYEYSQEALCLLLKHRDSEIERLKAELNNANNLADQMCGNVADLERQLAEARAKVERYEETAANMELLVCKPKTCQARKEAARSELERFKHMAEQNSTEMCEWVEKYNEVLVKSAQYKSAIHATGELITYPLRSKIVFDGNNKIPELQGIDSKRVTVLIMKPKE